MFHPRVQNELMRRHSHQGAESAQEVIRAHRRSVRQFGNRQWLINLRFDVTQDGTDAPLVAHARRGRSGFALIERATNGSGNTQRQFLKRPRIAIVASRFRCRDHRQ